MTPPPYDFFPLQKKSLDYLYLKLLYINQLFCWRYDIFFSKINSYIPHTQSENNCEFFNFYQENASPLQ